MEKQISIDKIEKGKKWVFNKQKMMVWIIKCLLQILITFSMLFYLTSINVISIGIMLTIVIWYPTKDYKIKIGAIVYIILLRMLANNLGLEFNFIPQAKRLLDVNQDLFYWLASGHVHATRLLVAYPAYLLSRSFNVRLNCGFTYYCQILFLIFYIVNVHTVDKLYKNINKKYTYVIAGIIPFMILPLIMNGRMIAAYLGFSLLINVFSSAYTERRTVKNIELAAIGLGFILTTVSSGTMTVASLYIVTFIYITCYRKRPKLKNKITWIIILCLPIFIQVIEYVAYMILRNINYFGGGMKGFINMFSHGLGKVFGGNTKIIISVICVGVIFIIINYFVVLQWLKTKSKYLTVYLAINISMYGLMFGFSTGLMMIPGLIVLMLLYISKWKWDKNDKTTVYHK